MTYDHIIIGGGIFGTYSAIYLAKKGLKICLIEKEAELFQKASVVNQARLHGGYHYPRSVATAMMSDENLQPNTVILFIQILKNITPSIASAALQMPHNLNVFATSLTYVVSAYTSIHCLIMNASKRCI
jgi:glycerol-3-phosphate dehydrogenase